MNDQQRAEHYRHRAESAEADNLALRQRILALQARLRQLDPVDTRGLHGDPREIHVEGHFHMNSWVDGPRRSP